MLKYILKRIGLAVAALIILLILVFFLMEAIPGYPLHKQPTWSLTYYHRQLAAAGLLANPIVQFWNFIVGIFHGHFGKVYSGTITNVIEYFLPPMKYSMMIAAPAFVLSTILGIGLGIIAAYFRGKWIDTLINMIAVIFIAIPSFILALALVRFAGVVGLPTQFEIESKTVTAMDEFRSAIMPVLAITLSSISIVLYYTRNELVDVFKQDYIKTALSKGITFRKIVFTHALRNGAIPILGVVLPSFVGILSGSIIVAKFFDVPGVSTIIVSAVQDKEIYVVLFAGLFYSGIYFALQIVVDISYTLIDPRIVIAQKNIRSIYQRLKARYKVVQNRQALFSDVVYFEDLQIQPFQQQVTAEESASDVVILPTKQEIANASMAIPQYTTVGQPVFIHKKRAELLQPDNFKLTNSLSRNNEQIVGKPSTYLKDVFKRFFKIRSALIFTIILGAMILMSIIIPLMSPDSLSKSIANYDGFIDYLPPRIPALGIWGIVHEANVNYETYIQLLYFKTHGYSQIFSRAVQQGSSFVLYNFDPYVLPGLKNAVLPMGTDGQGRNWWDMLWYSTAKSLTIAVISSLGSVIIGTIYGAISGAFLGKWPDNIMMRLVEIIGGVPLIVWILIISMALSGGSTSIFTVAIALVLTTWMWPAVVARTYVLKYKDFEFVYAAQTLGASKFRIIFTHLVPNVIGRLFVVFVNNIPSIIFFEASLVFLGLASTNEITLGTMINIAQREGYSYMLLGPTLTIVLITLSSQILANNLNDAIDPKIVS